MSKKFTGITSAGSAIPVYDKDAHSALQNKADVSALSAYQEKSEMTAYQPVGDYYSASNPSGFLTAVPADMATTGDIADLAQSISETYQPKGDYQPSGDYYSASNPSGFITGVDLTPYQEKSAMTAFQTIEGMSAYQPSGDYQAAGDYLSASESANFYPMTGNPSGFLTEHQSLDGLMQTSGLEYDGDKISGYMGSAFAGGGEVPEGVMVESAVGYNAVNEISGYNGSAIAQYGAEKQWLVHDDTLVHAANSAQYALGVNLSAVAQLLGVDETVLYSGIKNIGRAGTATYNLNESPMNFKTIKVLWCLRADTIGDIANKGVGSFEFEPDQFAQDYTYVHAVMNGANTTDTFTPYDIDTNINNIKTSAWNVKSVIRNIQNNGEWFHIYSIIGIGRKS